MQDRAASNTARISADARQREDGERAIGRAHAGGGADGVEDRLGARREAGHLAAWRRERAVGLGAAAASSA
jgi:hypothetical protein